ncbi:unnamed protein product [Dibothriocephalus latus]|uniref:Uncharacterized protein n=1 Tax=Dibothriocephalus latus TaxID=60516 RepID=A0A3P7NF70_DIBLA|nr:unnamed protein product [Dibothriocephalus latus]
MAAFDNALAKPDKEAADSQTQISIKVALSTLPIDEVGPVSHVTAYIELAKQPSMRQGNQSLSLCDRPSKNVWFMNDVGF